MARQLRRQFIRLRSTPTFRRRPGETELPRLNLAYPRVRAPRLTHGRLPLADRRASKVGGAELRRKRTRRSASAARYDPGSQQAPKGAGIPRSLAGAHGRKLKHCGAFSGASLSGKPGGRFPSERPRIVHFRGRAGLNWYGRNRSQGAWRSRKGVPFYQ